MKVGPSHHGGPGHRAGALRIEVAAMRSLGEPLLARWQWIQDQVPDFASPFLGPGWAKLVSACRRNVQVAVFYRGRVAVAFFPFELVEPGHGKPVGTIFSDYQAVVAEPGVEIDAERLLDAAELRRWDFDHLLKCRHLSRDIIDATASRRSWICPMASNIIGGSSQPTAAANCSRPHADAGRWSGRSGPSPSNRTSLTSGY